MESGFRLITQEDLPTMLKWGRHFDPRLEHYSFVDFDLDDIRSWYHTKQKFLTRKLYGLIVDQAVVGFITLKKINFIYRTAEIGIAVNPDVFGKGYGTTLIRSLLSHVFNTFSIETIFLDVAEFNVNARRLYEKCGFMYIGAEEKPYENQSNKSLAADFSSDFYCVEGRLYTKFLRMSYQKSTVSEAAPAKINFGLRVVGRSGVYHNLVTTMLTADFADIVHVRVNKKNAGIRILSRHEGIEEKDNLCYKAAQEFLNHIEFVDEACRDKSIEISIYKRIPEGAGMGGGSADAAAVLRALNQIYGMPFDRRQLEELALKIGSDVPFCIGGGAAIARGRGEQLEAFQLDKPMHLLVYPPSIKLSTASVFAEYDRLKMSEKSLPEEYHFYPSDDRASASGRQYDNVPRRYRKSVSEEEAYMEAFRLRQLIGKEETRSREHSHADSHGGSRPDSRPDSHGDSRVGSPIDSRGGDLRSLQLQESLRDPYVSIFEKLIRTIPPNDLEPATQNLVDRDTNDVKNGPSYAINLLRENGAVFAAMSGSGPSVYGIFESEYDARRAQKRLPQSIYSLIKQEDTKDEH